MQEERVAQLQSFGLMLPMDMQRSNEYLFCRKHIDGYLRKLYQEKQATERITYGVQLLTQWLSTTYFASKQARLDQIRGMDLASLVLDVFVETSYCQTPELFVAVTGKLAGRLGFDDKKDSIATIAEIVAVLYRTDVYDIVKLTPQASLQVVSCLTLPPELSDAIARSLYLPPMVCAPSEVRTNNESPYLTFNDNLMLGMGNSHSGDLCLDVINTQNAIPLSLDLKFLSTVEEEPKEKLINIDQRNAWNEFKAQSYQVYELLAKQGNRFWLTHKEDKRGRLYAQGYHVSSQGSAFKKAMIELADKEIINGVPG